jgi:hypothetical protein
MTDHPLPIHLAVKQSVTVFFFFRPEPG